jgi:hypothetical protein
MEAQPPHSPDMNPSPPEPPAPPEAPQPPQSPQPTQPPASPPAPTSQAPPPDPPLDDVWEEPQPPGTKWPKVIGTLSLIYAIGGLLCQSGMFAQVLLGSWLQSRFTNIDVPMPPLLRYVAIGPILLAFVLGWVMLAGAINLLRRRRSGVKALKLWVVLRLLVLVLGFGGAMLTFPTSIQYQRDVMDQQIAQAKRDGQPTGFIETMRDNLESVGMVSTAAISGVIAVYPFFLGFYLSRRKIDEEVAQWL